MLTKKSGFFALAAVLGLVVLAGVAAATDKPDNVVPGQYIVVLNDNIADVDGVANEMAQAHGLGLLDKYEHALKGFAATVPASRLNALKNDPRVAFVSQDRLVFANAKPGQDVSQAAQITPTGINRVDAELNSNKGAGIGVAVIDTGIDLVHPDVTGNLAAQSKTCVLGTRSAKDDNGHGTHVAGTIAALDNTIGVVGVAPQAKLFAVKVLNKNGSGTWSGVICGIDWVAANATALNIKVANMSLGGGGSSDDNCGNTNNDALHKAICKARDKGVTFVVAAGNSNTNANTSVPAAYNDTVITVSALADSDGTAGGTGPTTGYGADDTFATFSNYGSVVDIGAPGVKIYSTWKGGTYNTISGTSMATPHVAGAAALYIKSNPGATWTQVRNALVAAGEVLGFGHSDPSGKHPENVLKANAL